MRAPAQLAPPSAPQKPVVPAVPYVVAPDPEMAMTHAVPHVVVSQVLRPDVAAFIPPASVKMLTTRDAQCCVTTLGLRNTCKPIGPEVFVFAHQLPHLTAIDGEGLQGSLGGFKDGVFWKLRRLRLSDCKGIGAAFIAALPIVSYDLERLDLSGCSKLTADAFQHLPDLWNLRELTLDRCDGVNIEALGHVASVRSLTALSLRGCAGVNAHGLALLSRISLSVLNVLGCPHVDTLALLELPVMKTMRTLFVDSEHADVACKLLPFVQVRTSVSRG